MTTEIFIIIVSIFATFTSLITEALKMFCDSMKWQYASNFVVLFVSVIVGGMGTMIYYIIYDIPLTAINISRVVSMMLVTWLVSMLGCDKVMQAIKQMRNM